MFNLHLAVLLFGLAGVLSKFLAIPATVIVWGRTTFAVIATLIYLKIYKTNFTLRQKSDLIFLSLQGFVLGVHWFTFFYSIQVSSVAIGLLSFSTFPIFVLCFESIFYSKKIKLIDITGIVLILLGLFFIVPAFDFGNNDFQGILWGTISGLTFAILTILNRKFSSIYSATHISLIQNFFAMIVLTPWAYSTIQILTSKDWSLLIFLGVFCTALAHSLFINSLKMINAFTASIIASLEPVYGIIIALIILKEVPSLNEIIGGALIIFATLLVSFKT